MSNTKNHLLTYFDNNKEKLLEEFFHFLRFKSISSEREFATEVSACANWVEEYLQDIGMSVQSWSDYGHPVVMGSWLEAGPDAPTVLLYSHYDVQPVDPIDLWKSPPFEPEIRDGEIYARGATDDKGQCYYVLAALKAMFEQNGALPVNIKFVIEGEEETGSQAIERLTTEHPEVFTADYLLIVDTGFFDMSKPAVTLGVRGIITFNVSLTGSKTDLHSGTHGGIAYNTNHALIELLDKLRDKDGKITVPGFYDNIRELSSEERESISFDFDQARYEELFGGKPNGGEKAFTPIESAWLRPTLEINGMQGGYTGDGFKTVIPAIAQAKISCRLVPDQSPVAIGEAVAAFLRQNIPEGFEIEVKPDHAGAPLRTGAHSPVVDACAEAFAEVCEKPCQFILCGGSVPITSILADTAGAQTVLIGYGLAGDNLHAPNEHFGVERIRKGLATIGVIFEKISML